MNDARRLSYTTGPDDEGRSVERILRSRLHLTATMVRRAKFRPQGITLDGLRVRSIEKVHAGQTVSVAIGDTEEAISASDVAPASDGSPSLLHIVMEDDDIVICDKPAGVPMHPGPGHHDDTLGNLLMAHYLERGERVGFHPVHRLDMDTSGLVVVAKSAFAQNRLQRALHTECFVRRYLAFCEGTLPTTSGTIDAPIALGDDLMHREVRAGGKAARTHYRVLSAGNVSGGISLMELQLETGRTHQIRVHMASIGHPVLGDSLYGRRSDLIDRPALHSAHLEIEHPVTGRRLVFDSPLPPDMERLLETFTD